MHGIGLKPFSRLHVYEVDNRPLRVLQFRRCAAEGGESDESRPIGALVGGGTRHSTPLPSIKSPR